MFITEDYFYRLAKITIIYKRENNGNYLHKLLKKAKRQSLGWEI
jgi:hypothetical protein